jgi:hypothetical protein
MYLVFADRRGSFIFPSFFMIVIIGVPKRFSQEGERETDVSRGPGLDGLLAGTGNEPLQYCIQIRLFFRTYSIAAHLSVGDAFQVQRLDQFVDG